MVSPGILAALAAATAVRNRGFESRSLPPMRAAIVSSLMSLVKARPRRASFIAFLCLTVLRLGWPDLALSPLGLAEKSRLVLSHSWRGVNERLSRCLTL